MTQVTAFEELSSGPRTSRVPAGVLRLANTVRSVPNVATWTGVLLTTVGVVLVVVAWGKTAGLTNVALQLPFVLSAGFTGLGLVVTGLTVINVAAKRADAVERSRQLTELRGILVELRRAVEGHEGEDA